MQSLKKILGYLASGQNNFKTKILRKIQVEKCMATVVWEYFYKESAKKF